MNPGRRKSIEDQMDTCLRIMAEIDSRLEVYQYNERDKEIVDWFCSLTEIDIYRQQFMWDRQICEARAEIRA